MGPKCALERFGPVLFADSEAGHQQSFSSFFTILDDLRKTTDLVLIQAPITFALLANFQSKDREYLQLSELTASLKHFTADTVRGDTRPEYDMDTTSCTPLWAGYYV